MLKKKIKAKEDKIKMNLQNIIKLSKEIIL